MYHIIYRWEIAHLIIKGDDVDYQADDMYKGLNKQAIQGN